MGDNDPKDDKLTDEQKENLRVEYQTCQQAINGETQGHWTFAGIFLGLSITVLGIIIPNIFQIHNVSFKILVTFLSIGIIIIYLALDRLLARSNQTNAWFYKRMRAIEGKIGMSAQLVHFVLPREKEHGYTYWEWIFYTLTAFWLIIIVFTWIIW
jgi:hypothetical protein